MAFHAIQFFLIFYLDCTMPQRMLITLKTLERDFRGVMKPVFASTGKMLGNHGRPHNIRR
jgi:hypothetical protein